MEAEESEVQADASPVDEAEERTIVASAIAAASEAVNSLIQVGRENQYSNAVIILLEDSSAKINEAAREWSSKSDIAKQLSDLSVRNSLAAAADALAVAREQVGSQVALAFSGAQDTVKDASEALSSFRKRVFEYSMKQITGLDDRLCVSSRAWNLFQDALEYSTSLDEKYTLTTKVNEAAQVTLEEAHKWDEKLGVARRTSALVGLVGAKPLISYVSDLALSGYQASVDSLSTVKATVEANALRQMETEQEVATNLATA